MLSTVLFRADIAMLAAMQSSTDVGNYAAALSAVRDDAFPELGCRGYRLSVYSRLAPDRTTRIDIIFERSLKLVVALTLPAAVGAAVLANPLIELIYGSEYESAADALMLLAPAIALYPIAYLSGYLLVAQNRQRVLVPIYAAVAAENILSTSCSSLSTRSTAQQSARRYRRRSLRCRCWCSRPVAWAR